MHKPSSDLPNTYVGPDRRRPGLIYVALRQWFDIRRHPVVVSFEIAFFILLLGGGIRRWSIPVIVLEADGHASSLRVHEKTVGDVLALQKITLGQEDLC